MSALPRTGTAGVMVIGAEPVIGTGEEIRSVDPRTGAALDPGYPAASAAQVERDCAPAEQTHPVFREITAERRAEFLERIADLLDERRDPLVERAHTETALPRPRLAGEVGRTSGQPRLSAAELRAGPVAVSGTSSFTGMPTGVFSQLVSDPRIRAVGFTGPRKGGPAVAATAAARPVPIPVYAEMSSIKPVLLLPAAFASRGAELGAAFAGSPRLGDGQFCTNPGVVLAIEGPGLDAFMRAAADAVAAGATMLTTGMAHRYAAAGDGPAARDGVEEFAPTTDPRSTSVGTLAIERFLRPVAYQDVPDALPPAEVRDDNPLGVWRRTDGEAGQRALTVDSAA